jgi:hypothetical protein
MNRTSLIKTLIKRYKYDFYLEIGCAGDATFSAIDLKNKVGVDPKRGGTHRMTSDVFFEQNKEMFDLVFIDGLHEHKQVIKDVENSLQVLNAGGLIVLHDCNPTKEVFQLYPWPKGERCWNGTTWKAAVELRTRPDVDLAVGKFDYGTAVLVPRPNTKQLTISVAPEDLTWQDLETSREEFLRLMTKDELLNWLP